MRLRCNPELSVRKIDNELFIYNRDKALIHTFNRTGVFLWEAVEAGLPFDAMVGRMTDAFDVDKKQAAADAGEFIEKLRDLGLVDEAPE